ncbi:LacI family DNA-binding transcriptional regulator [Breznakiella homolactica]|uniref:LacI family DNA-binding transcriptional regulator n=1 Tax=Breznakiella homolactica TaxID=2798577 RepID=A0A7T7XJP0_9SPIR|nr:LacI family DNA-binding transcriptional regulator [Breznakiella homolactica]QQO07493.1 LacI family transcriptional regulator [Breznakiella homolactica]
MGYVTTKALAEYVGVSKMTISLYLRDPSTKRISRAVKDKIDTAMKDLDYTPSLKTQFSQGGRTNIIAVLMPFDNPIFKYEQVNEILSGFQSTLFQKSYSLIFLKVGTENGIPVIDKQMILQCMSFDGVVFFGTRYTRYEKMDDLFNKLKNYKIPFVVVNMPEIPLNVNQVVFRNDDSCAPIEYLFSLGHRKIVFMGGPADSYQTTQALDEYKDVHKRWKCKIDRNYILNGGFENSGAYEALERFIKKGLEFSAIYSLSMQMTAGCYKKLKEHSLRIPQDVSVLGYGDPYFSELLEPALSVVHLPLEDVGKRAALLLIDCIGNSQNGVREKIYLQNSMVIRRSTAVVKKRKTP